MFCCFAVVFFVLFWFGWPRYVLICFLLTFYVAAHSSPRLCVAWLIFLFGLLINGPVWSWQWPGVVPKLPFGIQPHFILFFNWCFSVEIRKFTVWSSLPCVYKFVFSEQGGIECSECPEGIFSGLSSSSSLNMDQELDTNKQVIVGICAMAKKSNSKPMKEILARLDEFEYIKTKIFPEETILKVSVTSCFKPMTYVSNLWQWLISTYFLGACREMASVWLLDIISFKRISSRKSCFLFRIGSSFYH